MLKDNRIFFTRNQRVLENGEYTIVGNIVNGQWFKCKKEAFKFVSQCAREHLTYEDILVKCEDEYTKSYIAKVIALLKKIGAIGGEEAEESNESKITDISIILTNGCNLKCKHCISSCGELKRKDLSSDEIKKVIKWCTNKSIKEITLTGGEIFIRKDIKEILEYVRQNYQGKISVITNGTLITDEALAILIKNVDQIDLSMDGYDDESVSQIRGKGVFEKVINTIERLHEHNFRKISLSMVLTGENRKHVEEFKSLCAKYDVQELLRVLSPGGRAEENFEELKDTEFEKLREIESDTKKNDVSEYSFKCVCEKINSELSIDENGKIYPCVLLQSKGFEIGSIDELETGHLKKLADTDPMIDCIEGCKECNIRYFCASNCLGLDLSIFSNEKAKRIHCGKMRKIYNAVWE